MSEEVKNKLWSKPEIADFLGISYSSIKKVVDYPDFPSPVTLWEGGQQKWIEQEVRDWVKTRRI